MEHGRSAEVNDLDNIIFGHDTIVEFQVAVRQAHGMQILDTIAYLSKYAIYLGPNHLA